MFTYFVLGSLSLILGLLAGAIMYRADFCMASAFRDMFLFRRVFMIKALLLLVVSTMVLFEIARLAGLLPLYPFPLLYPPTAANLIGGFIFGAGMVLAGGCVVGTLYKMGAGKVLSLAAFAGMIIGSAMYAEIHPTWVVFVKKTTFFKDSITLPQLLRLSPFFIIGLTVAACALLLNRWRNDGSLVRKSYADGYLQPWKAAVLLSVISLLSYVFVGMPLGITSSYAKLSGYVEQIFAGSHVAGLAYYKAVPLKYVHPMSGDMLQGGGGPVIDVLAVIQFPLIIGIILGSGFSAAKLGEFHMTYKSPRRQYVSALAGGIMLGLASRMAPTCNVWHIMGGLPILAISSMLFVTGMTGGAWLGGIILSRIVLKGEERQ